MEQFPRKISIEGTIGSGKTTIATALASKFGSPLILEEFHNNPFLPQFFNGHQDYAFEMECYFLMDRFDQLQEWNKNSAWISDYAFCKTEVYANHNLNQDEMALFKRIQSALFSKQQQPDCIVYISVSSEKAKERILKRGRTFELETPISYLEEINNQYLNYLQLYYPDLLINIDAEEIDIVERPEELEKIISTIQMGYKKKQYK